MFGSLGASQYLRPIDGTNFYSREPSPKELFDTELSTVKEDISTSICQLAFLRPLEVKDQYSPDDVSVPDPEFKDWASTIISGLIEENLISVEGLAAYCAKLDRELNDSQAFVKCVCAIAIPKLADLRNKYMEKHAGNRGLLQDLGLLKRQAFVNPYEPQPRLAFQPEPGRPAAAEPVQRYQGSLAFLREQFPAIGTYTDFDDTINGIKKIWEESHKMTAQQFLVCYLPKTNENFSIDDITRKFANKFFEYSKPLFVNSAMFERRKQEIELVNPEKDTFERCLMAMTYPYIVGIKTQLEVDGLQIYINRVCNLPPR